MCAAQARGAEVDVNKSGVHVQTNGKQMNAHDAGIVRAKDLTGLSVRNASNEKLGKIEDLVIDPAAGKVRYAVLSFGGIMGIGDKFFAVPWRELNLVSKGESTSGTEKERYCTLDVSKEALKAAPGFDKDNWPNFADANWSATIEKYYGTQRASRGTEPAPIR
jgi:sporulation protein YlmC with PRC-barrel domain